MKRRRLLQALAISASGIMFPFSFAASNNMSMIRLAKVEPTPDGIRMVFTVTGDSTTHGFILEQPHRAVLDFIGAPMFMHRELAEFNNALVKKVRFGLQSAINSRVVFDLNQPVKIETTNQVIDTGIREWTVWLRPVEPQPTRIETQVSAPEPVNPATASREPVRMSPSQEMPSPITETATPPDQEVAQTPFEGNWQQENNLPTNNRPSFLSVDALHQEGEILEIRFVSQGSIRHRNYSLASPNRGVVDFFETAIDNIAELKRFRNGFIRGVRIGHPFAKGTRIVFDCIDPVTMESNLSRQPDGTGEHLILRINPVRQARVVPSSPAKVDEGIPTADTPNQTATTRTTDTNILSPTGTDQSAITPEGSTPSASASPLADHQPSQTPPSPLPKDEGSHTVQPAPGPTQPPALPSPIAQDPDPVAVLSPDASEVVPTKDTVHYESLDLIAPKKRPLSFRARRAYEAWKDNAETVIMVDPGHGGIDPGAIGHGGTREKDITLAVAKRLMQKLNGHQNCKVLLTREDDRFLTLKNRIALARKARADLFLSLHADAYRDPNIHGASVFCLADGVQITIDEKDQQLAHRENASSDLQSASISGEHSDSLLELLQLDSIKRLAIADSVQFGHNLIQSLRGQPGISVHYPRVKRVNFLVLKNPGIPSSLVEMAFLSNIHDERRMLNAEYQEMMAQGLATGICKFFRLSSINMA
ncbi:MAG: N-acetylmuramoyl-L-alanine amidase [Magnetococcales bacterium]|nr:N-acetylmuramoyl-L-alanine amidase [Magnetococcales bacterium]